MVSVIPAEAIWLAVVFVMIMAGFIAATPE